MEDVTGVTFTRGEDAEGEAEPKVAIVKNVVLARVTDKPDKVTATFTFDSGEQLDGASATAIANYTIEGLTIKSAVLAAHSGTTQVVTLTLEEDINDWSGLRAWTVKNVKIADSTEVGGPFSGSVYLRENVRPTVEDAKLAELSDGKYKTIEVTFSENVDINAPAEFKIYVGAGDTDERTVTAVVTNDVVTLTIGDASKYISAADIAKGVRVEIEGVKDTNGNIAEDAVVPVTQ